MRLGGCSAAVSMPGRVSSWDSGFKYKLSIHVLRNTKSHDVKVNNSRCHYKGSDQFAKPQEPAAMSC